MKEKNFIEKALKMQCRFVGIKYSKELFNAPLFWDKYSWSWREESRFGRWFVQEARKDLKISKSLAKQKWVCYCLSYCWKYRTPPENE